MSFTKDWRVNTLTITLQSIIKVIENTYDITVTFFKHYLIARILSYDNYITFVNNASSIGCNSVYL